VLIFMVVVELKLSVKVAAGCWRGRVLNFVFEAA
jgi:hypothetical protein